MVAVNSCSGCSASAMRFRLEAARATACLVLLLSVRCSALSSAAFSGTVRLDKTSSPHARGLGWLGHKNSAGESWSLRCFAADNGSSLKRNPCFHNQKCCSLNQNAYNRNKKSCVLHSSPDTKVLLYMDGGAWGSTAGRQDSVCAALNF